MKDLRIRTVLVDIDGTLTDPKPGMPELPHVDIFLKLVAEANDVSLEKAERLVSETVASVGDLTKFFFPYGISERLGVFEDALWTAFAADAKKRLIMHSDAKNFLENLKKRHPDVKVFTATTNPRMIIFAKLALEGLADRYGSPYLDGAFGGEEVYPGGKVCAEFFRAILRRVGADPETTLMVGDHPKYDLEFAKFAGISRIVLARREQTMESVVEEDGGIYIKRLDHILDLNLRSCS